MREYTHSGGRNLDFINVESVHSLLSRDYQQWNFRDIYRIGALLKVCLTDHFGVLAWKLANRGSIEAEINGFARSGDTNPGRKAATPNNHDTRARTEVALAQSVRVMRACEEARAEMAATLAGTRAELSTSKSALAKQKEQEKARREKEKKRKARDKERQARRQEKRRAQREERRRRRWIPRLLRWEGMDQRSKS
jgi:hypothetical protein